MIAAVQLKKNITSTGILGIIIYKLSYQQEPSPIIPLKINKDSKISFYSAILLFYLAVNLGLENNKEFLLNAKEITEQ